MRANLALLFAAIAATLGVAELALRIVGFDISYWYAVRYAFASPGSYTQIAPGVPARRPNAALRQAAVYAVGAPTLEYDYVMRTNNLGFAQDRDLACGKPTAMVLGDSFTEGMGAPPWFGAVENAGDAAGMQIANLGFLGTGVLNWRAMTDRYAGCLTPAKALIVYISHDWFRPYFGFSDEQIACIDGNGPCVEPGHLWFPVADGADAAWLIERAKTRDAARFAAGTWRDRLTRADIALRHRSYVFALARNAGVALLGIGEGRPPADVFDQSTAAFAAIVAKFGRENVRLLFVPQADETATGQSNGHSRIVAEWLAREGWSPAACELANGDYLPFDRHPNAAGYRKIAQCVRLELSKLIDGR